ncbi:MAG: hypothetical protein JWL89_60 [Candidatus Saccharibacteria bacterium]|nr:hypothetical protein [Candidatus Saccharibacteria bacterium]
MPERMTGRTINLDWMDLEGLADEGILTTMHYRIYARNVETPHATMFRDDCGDSFCEIYLPEGTDFSMPIPPTEEGDRIIARIGDEQIEVGDAGEEARDEWLWQAGDIVIKAVRYAEDII